MAAPLSSPLSAWHSMDLTDFDLAPAVRTARKVSGKAFDTVTNTAKDATYVTVGLGLLVFQRAQVQRRQFEKAMREAER